MEKENHGSVPHRSTYDALEALYDGWALPRNIARNGDLAAFDEHFAALSARYGYTIEVPEATVNQLGYRLMSEKKINDALGVFTRNATRYPGSANAYDSLGDAYDAAGLWEKAAKSYAKACTMGGADDHPNAELYCANAKRANARIGQSKR
jgi:tetratricopeptide (TPR) repeat protein